MTVDVYLKEINDLFIDEIDEIKEDTMVEIFIIHPRFKETLDETKGLCAKMNGLFYCAPLSLKDLCDEKCLAYYVDDISLLDASIEKPIYVDAEILDTDLQARLIEGNYKGIILNASTLYNELSAFFVAIGPSNINSFDIAVLANASMNKIVLQSTYPEHDFEDIFTSVKQISSALFRPEESIIARATLHTLTLFSLK